MYPWYRYYSGTSSDPKLRLVARQVKLPMADVLACWIVLLEQASDSDPRGQVRDVDFEAFDCMLDWPDGRSKLIHGRLVERGLVDDSGVIRAWSKRQPKREREDDKSADRVKAHRQRKHQETPSNAKPNHETPSNAKPSQETPRQIDRLDRQKEGGHAPEGAPPPTMPAAYRKYIETERPDLKSPDLVFANFWDRLPAERRTLPQWRIWVRNEHADKEQPSTGIDPDSLGGVRAQAAAKGVSDWDELRETFDAYKARVRAAPWPGGVQ
jgi:hypothetical protein